MILDYKGTKIFYTNKGTGAAIILLHGFLENHKMWDYIPYEVFKSCQIVTVDLLGHGNTGCIGYIHSMEDMAKAVLAVVKKLQIEIFKVIGHSMGGYVAIAMAKLRPDLVTGICLLNSTFNADNKERIQIRKRAIEMAKTNYTNLVRMSFLNLFAEQSRFEFKEEIDLAVNEALKTPMQGYIAAQEGMIMRSDGVDVIENFERKIFIILGLEDSIVNIGAVREQVIGRNVKIHEISGGHMSHIENIKDLSYIIKRYVEN